MPFAVSAARPLAGSPAPSVARRRAVGSLALALLLAGSPAAAWAADLDISAALREAVTVEGVFRHLHAFQDIATEHGGNRAAGTPGYDASAGYVAGALRGAGYAVELQEFSFPYFEETAPPALGLGNGPAAAGEAEIRTLMFSGAGEVEGRIEAVAFAAPDTANGSTSGCGLAHFRGFAAGSIALVRRGTCPFQTKVENAVAFGAVGVVIANDGVEGRTDAFPGRLTAQATVPVVAVAAAVGERLARAARGGATAHLAVAAETGERTTRNVIADTADGEPGRTVLVGAHLDSVPAGPGLNDNGSGVAVVLEIARQIARLGIRPAARVRFAFWGAEELGLIGSRHYVDGLSGREHGRIAAALNFDMLGSPNHGRFVYDGDGSHKGAGGPAGSGAIERVFRDYFRAAGLAAEPVAIDDSSDHASFAVAGIPVGGLYAGGLERKSRAQAGLYGGAAERPFDPCLHRACDTLANVGARAVDELADAAAHAVLALALAPERGRGARLERTGAALPGPERRGIAAGRPSH